MAFGRPFIDETGLVYNREEGTVMFKQDDEIITFKMQDEGDRRGIRHLMRLEKEMMGGKGEVIFDERKLGSS
ncbi:hypothetical protein Tco_0784211 [Tanacetum coccineum]